jgi:hypothetical protein
MPPNDSSTGGYVVPISETPPLDGNALYAPILAMVVALTGISSSLVVQAYQDEPPNIPKQTNLWAAVAIHERRSPAFPNIIHNPAGEGTDTVDRQQEFDVLVSFFGLGNNSGTDAAAELLKDCLAIAQNRDTLYVTAGLKVAYVGAVRPAPVLLKERWNYRVDLPIVVRRADGITFPILNLESVKVEIFTDAETDEGEFFEDTRVIEVP